MALEDKALKTVQGGVFGPQYGDGVNDEFVFWRGNAHAPFTIATNADGRPITGSPCIGNETLTVTNSPAPLADIPPAASLAFITLDDHPIRIWLNGDNPTPTQGHRLTQGAVLVLESQNQIQNFRAIREGASNGVLQVSYF
jgi:hypothetical protein